MIEKCDLRHTADKLCLFEPRLKASLSSQRPQQLARLGRTFITQLGGAKPEVTLSRWGMQGRFSFGRSRPLVWFWAPKERWEIEESTLSPTGFAPVWRARGPGNRSAALNINGCEPNT